ncbi:TRI25 ligase, partial [Polypterus senegalus]
MAEAQMFVSQDKFTCSVCLDTLTDPVSIPCGHNFCLKCLTDCWDQSQVCSCPQCRHTFTTRPELNRNTLLNEVIKKLKKTKISPPSSQNYAGPGDVECDVCTGKKFRAVKSCLTCLASFCPNHLQPHFKGAAWKRHKLVDPDGYLKEKLCEKHQKSLEMFCRTDDSCICLMCAVTGHKNHEMAVLETEREEKQKQLGETLSEIRRRLEKREKKLKEMRRTVEQMKISVEREIEENEKSFTTLIRCIEEAHRKLTERIREQEKRETEKAEGVIERLEKEIEELRRREAELKEHSETKDHLHFLQVRATLHMESDQTGVCGTGETLESNLKDLRSLYNMTRTGHLAQHRMSFHIPLIFSKVQYQVSELLLPFALFSCICTCLCKEVKMYEIYTQLTLFKRCHLKIDFCPLTLDINTAHRDLRLSEGNKKVTREVTKAEYPDHPDRFDWWCQVLCREALTGTRCYWEVECSGDFMRIGVAYKGLSRKGEGMECGLGNNDKSWSLLWSHPQYIVRHNYKQTVISAPYSPRIGFQNYNAAPVHVKQRRTELSTHPAVVLVDENENDA